MLEFVALYFLARRNGRAVEAKGRSGNSYRWLTVGLWFGGEILGFILAIAVLDPGSAVSMAYVFALLGAACGAAVSWLVADSVKPGLQLGWYPNALTPPDGLPAWVTPDASTAPSTILPGNVELVAEGTGSDWALVSAPNGWRGYVDGRALLPHPRNVYPGAPGS